MTFKVVEKIKLWLGWCPRIQGMEFEGFKLESDYDARRKGGPSSQLPIVVGWLGRYRLYHNEVLIPTVFATLVGLAVLIEGVLKNSQGNLQLFSIGLGICFSWLSVRLSPQSSRKT